MTATKNPVTLLTGFLGAGKTTFLNALMNEKPQTRFAIIENEIGEQGVDGDLIVGADENLVALNNGCICCSLNGNLLEILESLYERADEWDELLIEATGIADPSGVASPFFNHPAIKKHFQLQQIIGLIDGVAAEDHLAADDTAAKQLAFSDTLLINKTDRISSSEINRLKSLIRESNPLARIFEGNQGHYPIHDILAVPKQDELVSTNATDHSEHDHTDHHGIQSLTFTFYDPFDVDLLTNALKAFLMFQSKDVYRIKGQVYDPKRPTKQWVQTVMDTVAVEEGEPWQPEEPKKSEVVVIGRNLQRKGYERMLRKGLAH